MHKQNKFHAVYIPSKYYSKFTYFVCVKHKERILRLSKTPENREMLSVGNTAKLVK